MPGDDNDLCGHVIRLNKPCPVCAVHEMAEHARNASLLLASAMLHLDVPPEVLDLIREAERELIGLLHHMEWR